MFIHEVEHLVGLSKKTIRYYEELGLIYPKRNMENDYRIYGEEEIKKLKILKFLRELGVPICDLKLLKEQRLSLKECLEGRIYKIEMQEKNYEKVKNMCLEIIDKNEQFETFDISKYFMAMNTLNKEGFTMRDIETKKRKKILGAIFSSFLFGFFFLFLVGIMSYFQFTEEEALPWALYILFAFFLLIPVFGIVWNLIARIKEILGGEEDEASKY